MEAVNQAPSRRLRSNVVINLVRTLTLTLLSFITFPYVTRALGDSLFGWYNWANTFVYYFLILAKISIPNVAIRECAKVKNDKEALSRKVQGFFFLQAITTLLSFGSMVGIAAAVPSLWDSRQLIFLLSINFLAGAFSFEWVYIALEKHTYITIRSISLIALSSLLTFLFIHHYDTESFAINSVYVYALIAISYTLLTSLINAIILPKYISFSIKGPFDFKGMAKPLLTLFLISIALTLYNQTDAFLLGVIDKTASVGSYAVGIKGIEIIITLTTSLYAVFLPRSTALYEKEDKTEYRKLLSYSFNVVFFIAIPAIATMASLSTPITELISGSSDAASGQYNDANIILACLCSMMLTYSIGDAVYNEILLPQKKEKEYLIAMTLGFIANVGLSMLFAYVIFPQRKAIGVALATSITDLLMAAYLFIKTKNWSKKPLFNLNNAKILIVGILIFALTFFLSPLLRSAFVNNGMSLWQADLFTLLIFLVGDGFIYLGLLALLKENIVFSLLPKRKKKNDGPNE